MIESKYLKQADVPDPVIVTVAKIGKINIAKEGETPEMKWAARFREFPKAMLLNSTNIKLLEKATGSDNTDDWIGKEVILYNDENVMFGNEVVGGLRIRKQQAAPKRRGEAPQEEFDEGGTKSLAELDDDIPF
jgi:hypothetical protein